MLGISELLNKRSTNYNLRGKYILELPKVKLALDLNGGVTRPPKFGMFFPFKYGFRHFSNFVYYRRKYIFLLVNNVVVFFHYCGMSVKQLSTAKYTSGHVEKRI